MTTYSMHLFSTHSVLGLVHRVDRIIANADLTAWRSLHDSLSLVRPPPRLWNDSLRVESQPITQCSYHYSSKLPDLVADQLPDRRSINRVMRSLVEMTALERCMGGWAKFGSDYDILVHDHVLRRHRALVEHHQRFMNLILAPQQSEIAELEFLRNPDAYCSVTSTEMLAAFVEAQEPAGYFATCVQTFRSMPDDIWRIFAADIRRLELFLRSASLSQQRAVWFTCYVT
jgi:hypothetical protein